MNTLHRRRFMAVCSSLGLSSTLLPGVLWGITQSSATGAEMRDISPPASTAPKITADMIDGAAAIAGVHIEDNQKQMMLQMLNDDLKGYQQVRELHLANRSHP